MVRYLGTLLASCEAAALIGAQSDAHSRQVGGKDL